MTKAQNDLERLIWYENHYVPFYNMLQYVLHHKLISFVFKFFELEWVFHMLVSYPKKKVGLLCTEEQVILLMNCRNVLKFLPRQPKRWKISEMKWNMNINKNLPLGITKISLLCFNTIQYFSGEFSLFHLF